MDTNLMIKLLNSLKETLNYELESVKKIYQLENNKYDELRDVNLKEIMKINIEEDYLLQYLDSIENKRSDLVSKISKELKCNEITTINEIINNLPDDFQEYKNYFDKINQEIRSYTKKLLLLTKENSELIRINLDIINMTLSYSEQILKIDTYNNNDIKNIIKSNKFLINQIV